jgi:DNA-binding NarL/FixJ family response regulator
MESPVLTALGPVAMPGRRFRLTPRERDLARAVMSGACNKHIAAALGLSEQTVKNRLSGLYRKLGVSTRLELAVRLFSADLLAQSD